MEHHENGLEAQEPTTEQSAAEEVTEAPAIPLGPETQAIIIQSIN